MYAGSSTGSEEVWRVEEVERIRTTRKGKDAFRVWQSLDLQTKITLGDVKEHLLLLRLQKPLELKFPEVLGCQVYQIVCRVQ
jgi:hypothetical protein